MSICFGLLGQNSENHDDKVRRKIVKLTKKMIENDMIFGRAVGAGAVEMDEHKAFKKFVEEATLHEIVILTEHKNPLIRGYSFWAIVIRDKKMASDILKRFETDKVWVDTCLYGCVPTPYKLDHFANLIFGLSDIEMDMYYKK
jgi:hypothetical protein